MDTISAQIAEFLNSLEYWHWLVFGVALMGVEMLAPSAVFLWPGIAAIVAGVLKYLFPVMSGPAALLIWAVLAAGMAAGWQVYRKHRKDEVPNNTINRRGEQYVGRHFTLSFDIVNGIGELYVDDTRWKIVSDRDLPKGGKVKVTAVEGTSLRVEPFEG